jgi:hypothetical protein
VVSRHRLDKGREAAADHAFLNGDRHWSNSFHLNGRSFLSRATGKPSGEATFDDPSLCYQDPGRLNEATLVRRRI